MKISEMMTSNPEWISPQATLAEAAERMARLNCGAIPVVQNDVVQGVITDRDIVIRAIAQHKDPEQERVGDYMSDTVACCYDDQDVQDAIKLMESKKVRRIPVLNRADQLIGIVSLGDIATQLKDYQLSGQLLAKVSTSRQAAAPTAAAA